MNWVALVENYVCFVLYINIKKLIQKKVVIKLLLGDVTTTQAVKLNKFIFSEFPLTQSKMAGAEAELAGMAKHFNAVTNYGRANVAKVILFNKLILTRDGPEIL